MIKKHPQSSTVIATDINSAWALLTAFTEYKNWQPGLSFNDMPAVGADSKMQIRLAGMNLTVKVRFEIIDPQQKTVQWIGGPQGWISGQHYFRLEAIDAQQCRLIQGERFRGVCVNPIWACLGRALTSMYARFDQAFVSHFEQRH